MRYYLAHPFAFGPWWLWLLIAVLGLLTVIEFAYIRWWFRTAQRLSEREIALVAAKTERLAEDFYWDHFRAYETVNAMRITVKRAIDELPARITDLLDRDSTTLKAVS